MIAMSLAGAARAQQKQTPKAEDDDVAKVEVGAQYSMLRLNDTNRQVAGGGRVTFNLSKHFALEAEADFFPFEVVLEDFVTGGRAFQMQFGVKAGKRFRRFGLFAKARPGFISFGATVLPELTTITTFGGGHFIGFGIGSQRKTHPSLDLGGVVEFYATRRVFARFDAGDTIIRYGSHREFSDNFSSGNFFAEPGPHTGHNLQLSAGVGFRLGSRGGDGGPPSTTKGGGRRSEATRFEAGAQFTSLSFSPVGQLAALPLVLGPARTMTEFGFGGRFTYNLNRAVAVEAETNFLPQDRVLAAGVSGRVTQGQFGVKAGRRFRSFGLFAKARPGFVSFGDTLKLIRTIPFTIDGHQHSTGVFEEGRRTFFSADVGGVIELYASRRWLLRFDAGDTVIHYGERSIEDIEALAVRTRSPETHHNFQFSSGVSFRF
jgi:hypothetical protein